MASVDRLATLFYQIRYGVGWDGLGWDVGSSPAGPCFAWFRSTKLVLVGSQVQLVVVVRDDHLHRIAYSVGSIGEVK